MIFSIRIVMPDKASIKKNTTTNLRRIEHVKNFSSVRAGLGSSFACQMSAEAVLKDLGVDAKMDHTDISSVSGAQADIIIAAKNFEKQFERYTISFRPTVFLERLVDKNEIGRSFCTGVKRTGRTLKTRGKRK